MTYLTIVGNLASAPELRFTTQGKAVASFTVAESHGRRENGEYKETSTTFWRCTVWGTAAENVAESLDKGHRVIVVGEAKQRSFENNAGEKRTVIEISASEVGPALRWATAKVAKTSKGAKPEPEGDQWGSPAATGARAEYDGAEAPF